MTECATIIRDPPAVICDLPEASCPSTTGSFGSTRLGFSRVCISLVEGNEGNE